ncbi:MAG: hypothetical protein ACREAT_07255, partial [Nitrosotalea sp.]
MKYWYVYIGIAVATVIIGAFLIFHFESRRADQDTIPPVADLQTPTNEIAKTLAENSVLVKTIVSSGDYQYKGVFYSGNHGVTFLNVFYQSNSNVTGPLIVTEDANSTKIL